MRLFLIVSSLLLLSISVQAQRDKDKDIPGWGKIDKIDLEMKECLFEKEAEAMILIKKGDVVYQRGSRYPFAMKKEVRTRIKILKEQGFKEADIKIHYYHDNNFEKLIDIDAVTYNLDETGKIIETKVDNKSIFRQKVDAKVSSLSFTFPNVKVGTIIEYRYTVIRDDISLIDPWIFQEDIPTQTSVFTISFPEYFRFLTNKYISLPLESKQDENTQTVALSGGNVKFKTEDLSFKMKQIPSLKEEPYMGARRDYLQRVEFQLSQFAPPNEAPIDMQNTWPRLVEHLLSSELLGVQLKKNISLDPIMQAKIKSCKTKSEIISTIYRIVQQKMSWNGVNDYYCESAKDCWAKNTGSTGDINIILLNILKEYGITAYPVLTSTRDHGKVYSAYPLLSQFNNLVVLAQSEEDVFVLNAADKFNPPGLIPYDVLGTEGFIVDKENMGFATLWNSKKTHKQIIGLVGTVDEKDQFTGEATVTSMDYARNPRVKTYKDGSDVFIKKYFSKEGSGITISDLQIDNLENDSLGLQQRFKFKTTISNSGDYHFFTLNLFSGLEKNYFISEKRQTAVDFGMNQYYMITGGISIPVEYQFEELPKNLTLIMPDTSIIFRRLVEASNGRINFRITLEFNRPSYEIDEYDYFREFYKRLFDALNEQIIFRRKAQPKPKP